MGGGGGGEHTPTNTHTTQPDDAIDENNMDAFIKLWADAGIQATFDNSSKFQLTDSAKYFFEKITEVTYHPAALSRVLCAQFFFFFFFFNFSFFVFFVFFVENNSAIERLVLNHLPTLRQVAAKDYLPTEQDVLRSRVRTTGIVENSFEIDGTVTSFLLSFIFLVCEKFNHSGFLG